MTATIATDEKTKTRYYLDTSSQGTDTLNYELVDYKIPAVIIQAEPIEPTIKELEDDALYVEYGTNAARDLYIRTQALKKWRSDHRLIIPIEEDQSVMEEYFNGQAKPVYQQAADAAKTEGKTIPDWIKNFWGNELGTLTFEIECTLLALYKTHLSEFTYHFLPTHYDGMTLADWKQAPPKKKTAIFIDYWNWY